MDIEMEEQEHKQFVTSDTSMEISAEDSSRECVVRTCDTGESENRSQSTSHADGRRENLESILLGYWERGMTDLSSQSGKQLATEALHNNPGINRKQIKDWIGNYKKKISGKKTSRVKRSKVALRKKKVSARDVFQEHYLRENSGNMNGLEEAWSALQHDKHKFDVYVKASTERNASEENLTEKEEIKAMKISKELQRLSSELQNIGYDSVGVVFKANTNVCSHCGSSAGKKFLEQGSTYWEFLSYVNANKEKKEEREWEMLRSEVQEKLNTAYKDSNIGGKHVEWSKVRKGIISACGFPAGLKPGPASSFGKENLLRILSDEVAISFVVGVNSAESINLTDPAEIARMLEEHIENEEHIEEDDDLEGESGVGVTSDETEIDREETGRSIERQNNAPQQVSETTEENVTYLVERLLDMKVIRKKKYYLVKWRRFADPTWEPHENIPLHIKRSFNKEKKQ